MRTRVLVVSRPLGKVNSCLSGGDLRIGGEPFNFTRLLGVSQLSIRNPATDTVPLTGRVIGI